MSAKESAGTAWPPSWWPAAKPFVNGGTAATIGITIFNPIDVVKTRLQIAGGGSPFTLGAKMVAQEGFGSLYAGLSAQYLRAWTYQTARLGAYRSFVDLMTPASGQVTPLWQKAVAGLSAGAIGAVVGNPAELAIIRMQSDKTLPEAQRRNYKGIIDALTRVVRSEGVLALWTGAAAAAATLTTAATTAATTATTNPTAATTACGAHGGRTRDIAGTYKLTLGSAPTIVRAMALNCGALASYDQSKEMIDEFVGQKNSRTGIAGASMLSGVIGAVFSLPFDFVKTQIQRMKPDPVTGLMPYKGAMDCFSRTLAEHGPLRFYAGEWPRCARRRLSGPCRN